MAVAPTGAIFKSLIFDNENSRNYGVYITGEAVYNAPEREVEMISIPGRNGAFALDKGRFENIEVTYHAGIFADTEDDFAQAVSDFRNVLCSRTGYCRLTDEYNLDEYRMAIYKSGLEVTPATLRAGEFDIVFDCKPQRYLMSGESELSVSDGDVIFNPTLFDASPLLEVEGYGTVSFNGYSINFENAVLGETKISDSSYDATVTLNVENLNAGDEIFSKSSSEPYAKVKITTSGAIAYYNAISQDANSAVSASQPASNVIYVTVAPKLNGLVNGRSATITTEALVSIQIGATSYNNTLTTTVTYDANKNEITLKSQFSNLTPSGATYSPAYRQPEYYGNSTKPLLGSPTYIDCELGEAYRTDSGTPISLNRYIDLSSDLPTLAVGSNEITFDNTITDLKIIPRWWQV